MPKKKTTNPKLPKEVDLLVGNRIREARKALGMTQEGLAERLQISFQQIQKYETGRNRISAGTLHRVSIELSRPISWFFELDQKSKNQAAEIDDALYAECLETLFNLRKSKDLKTVRDYLNKKAKAKT